MSDATKLALVPQTPSSLTRTGGLTLTTLEEFKDVAVTLSRSGLLPRDLQQNAGNVFLVLMAGAELGLGPAASIRSLHVVDGKVGMSSELILARLLAAGVKIRWVESTDKVARLRMERPGFDPHEEEYTYDDAKRAGLTGKKNWQSYPKQMLRARCVSSAARAYAPDLMGGGVVDMDELDDVRETTVLRREAREDAPEEYDRAKLAHEDGEAKAKALAEEHVPTLEQWRDAAKADESVRDEVYGLLRDWCMAYRDELRAIPGTSATRKRIWLWLWKVAEACGAESSEELKRWLSPTRTPDATDAELVGGDDAA